MQLGRENFLLPGEAQIEREEKLPPGLNPPIESAEIREKRCAGIELGSPSAVDEINVSVSEIIGRHTLGGVTQSGRECKKQHGRRRALDQASQRQMKINAHKDQMIDQAIDNASLAAAALGQPRQLSVSIVEGVGPNVQEYSRDVGSQITVKIKVTGRDSQPASDQCDYNRRSADCLE